jgi:multicomponent Na+:H+ antiporter subunit D
LAVVAAFAIAGVPGFNEFVSKGLLLDAAQYGGFEGVFWLLTLAGVGTAVSLPKLGYYAFVRPAPADFEAGDVDGVPLRTATPLLTLANLCVGFGPVPGALFALVGRVRRDERSRPHRHGCDRLRPTCRTAAVVWPSSTTNR